MEKMNVPQLNAYIKAQAVAALNEKGLKGAGAVQTNNYTFDIPVTVDGETYYAKVELTARNMKGTSRTSAFTLDGALAKWQDEKDEDARKAAEKAEKNAKKAAEKAKKDKEKAAKE
jgi:membrane protein involved in colicin uptake